MTHAIHDRSQTFPPQCLSLAVLKAGVRRSGNQAKKVISIGYICGGDDNLVWLFVNMAGSFTGTQRRAGPSVLGSP